MTRIADQPMILADTGPFCRLAEAGEAQLTAGALYLEPNVHVVMDVHRELRRRSNVPIHGRLKHLLDVLRIPHGEPITVTDKDLLDRIDAILEGRRRFHPGHQHQDRGEVTTVLVAADRKAPVLMDDGFGKRLAAQEGIDVFATQDLAVELAARGQLGRQHAYGLYRLVYTGASREQFDQLVDDATP